MRHALVASLLAITAPSAIAHADSASAQIEAEPGVRFASLESLTVDALRQRRFASTVQIEADLSERPASQVYSERFFGSGAKPYVSTLASYRSDGLRIYARVDVPAAPAPKGGYPVVVFLHGWVGYEAALDFHFSYTPDSIYAEMIDAYAKAGFVVVTPGYRGHGRANGVVAGGRASMAAWDNATHVSPILYAIDSLNLIEGLHSLEKVDWRKWGHDKGRIRLNLRRLSVAGHSQGGDVALIVLAVSGKGSRVVNRPRAGSIMSGTFPGRFTQVETFRPMAMTSQAYLAGDETWTGSATGRDGRVNPHFVFGWPSDGNPMPLSAAWVEQRQSRPEPSVREVIEAGYGELYKHVRDQVADLGNVDFAVVPNDTPSGYVVRHDPRLAAIMARLGAFHRHDLITARLTLHFPDRDYYSLPSWNRDLCGRINSAGGDCAPYEYVGNNHSLRLSPKEWFSPKGSKEAYGLIIQRDLAAFSAR